MKAIRVNSLFRRPLQQRREEKTREACDFAQETGICFNEKHEKSKALKFLSYDICRCCEVETE